MPDFQKVRAPQDFAQRKIVVDDEWDSIELVLLGPVSNEIDMQSESCRRFGMTDEQIAEVESLLATSAAATYAST